MLHNSSRNIVEFPMENIIIFFYWEYKHKPYCLTLEQTTRRLILACMTVYISTVKLVDIVLSQTLIMKVFFVGQAAKGNTTSSPCE